MVLLRQNRNGAYNLSQIYRGRLSCFDQLRIVDKSVLHRRCIIPAKHFYEWDPDKDKVTFQSENPGTYSIPNIRCLPQGNGFQRKI